MRSVGCHRRIAKATGGQVVLTLADMDGQETFDASTLGTASEVKIYFELEFMPF